MMNVFGRHLLVIMILNFNMISWFISPGKVKPQITNKAQNVQAGQPLHILVVVTFVNINGMMISMET
jgi:hypothetical protein